MHKDRSSFTQKSYCIKDRATVIPHILSEVKRDLSGVTTPLNTENTLSLDDDKPCIEYARIAILYNLGNERLPL